MRGRIDVKRLTQVLGFYLDKEILTKSTISICPEYRATALSYPGMLRYPEPIPLFLDTTMEIKSISRRRFVQTGLCGLVVGAGMGLPLLRDSSDAWAHSLIRPPGALSGDDFYAACIRCGLCVEACPYDTLRLFGPDGTNDTGTPYFVAREVPCEMCPDIPCLNACPTGALDPVLDNINDANMGLAVLTNPERCNSYVGNSYCDSCVQACPLQGVAITLEVGPTPMGGLFTPTVNADACTGCGKCEQACIAQPQAIRVIPSHVPA